MSEPLIVWTYDRVPGGQNGPSGYVRDIRLRWACEEAGLDYVIRSVPFDERGPEHLARQPFGQVPFLEEDGLSRRIDYRKPWNAPDGNGAIADLTLPVYIWGQLRFAAKLPNVLALGSILIAASLVLLTAAELFRRRAERKLELRP